MEPFRIQTLASPAPNFKRIIRAGIQFVAGPRSLTVTDAPASPDEITPAQYEALKREQPGIDGNPAFGVLLVADGEGAGPAADAMIAIRKGEEQIAALRLELAGVQERASVERERLSSTAEALAAQVAALESERDNLRSKLAEAQQRRGR